MDTKGLNPVINKMQYRHLTNQNKHSSVKDYMDSANSLQQGGHQLLAESKSEREKGQACAVNKLIRAFFGNTSDNMAKDGAVNFISKIAHQSVSKFNVINMIMNSDDETIGNIARELIHKKNDSAVKRNKSKKSSKENKATVKSKDKKARTKKSAK